MDFAEIFSRYYEEVFRFALSLTHNSHEAEELTQETFYRALRAYPAFRGECRVEVWLCQIAKNRFFTQTERKRRFLNIQPDWTPAPGDFTEEVSDQMEAGWILQKALWMAAPYREVFLLRVAGGFPFGRIAELYGKSESWARVTYSRAKAKLREQIKEEYE